MRELITQCHNFLKDCGLLYAFCGGYAFELFTNKKIRPHSDIDITVFDEDRKNIVTFMVNKGWSVYEPILGTKSVRLVSYLDDERVLKCHCLWAIKANCSFLKLEPKQGESNIFEYDILSNEQVNFDFIEIIFNQQQNGRFVCDKNKNITRELDKAILYNDDIPYLAPELMLFIISNPVYIDSEYHKEKNTIDFTSTIPFLPEESKKWLINGLSKTYPEGNKRLDELKKL